MQGKSHLNPNIRTYNGSVLQHVLRMPISEEEVVRFSEGLQIQELEGQNESVDELFSQARNEASVTSDLSELYI